MDAQGKQTEDELFKRYREVFLRDFVMSPSMEQVKDLIVYDCGKEQCVESKYVGSAVKPYFLFHYIEHGNGTFIQGKVRYEVKADEMFVIFPHQEIEYFSGKKNPWLYKWFSVGGLLAQGFVERAGITLENPIVKVQKNQALKEAISSLINCYLENGKIVLGCEAYLYMIFHNLIERDKPDEKKGYANQYINEAIMFINYNINIPIEVGDVAKSINLNQRYFIDLFFRHVGQTPKQYIIATKMEQARNLLKGENAKVNEVAADVGYKDAFHFSKEFKRHFGISPKQFQLTVLGKGNYLL